MTADLHLHTTASDGSHTPGEIVDIALDLDYKAIAITDHDTVDGIREAIDAAEDKDIEIIPGIEINTDAGEFEVHILGYYIDYTHEKLLNTLKKLKKMRVERAKKMVKKLNNLGLTISWTDVKNMTGDGVIGRTHIARILRDNGSVRSIYEAFDKYIGKNCPAYVPRYKLTPGQAVNLIKDIGGVSVLAHPGLIGSDVLISEVINSGIDGIEVYYYEHEYYEIDKYKQLAVDNNLIITGGSDDHGPDNKDGSRLGYIRIDYTIVDKLKNLSKTRKKE